MKKVFICSPYKGDIIYNVKLAIQLCKLAFNLGCAPYAPHLLYPQILDEDNEEGRALGISAGIAFLKTCDEVWVVGEEITEGMGKEINAAEEEGIPIKCVKLPEDFLANASLR